MELFGLFALLSDTVVQMSFAIGKWFLEWQIYIVRTILSVTFLPFTVLTAAAREKQMSSRVRTLAVEYNALAALTGDTEAKLAAAEKEASILKEKLEIALQQRAHFKQRCLAAAAQVRALDSRAVTPAAQGDHKWSTRLPRTPAAAASALVAEEHRPWGKAPSASPLAPVPAAPPPVEGKSVEERWAEELGGSGIVEPAKAIRSDRRGGNAPATLRGRRGGAAFSKEKAAAEGGPSSLALQGAARPGLDKGQVAHDRRWEEEPAQVEREILVSVMSEARRACYTCIGLVLGSALGALATHPGPDLPWAAAAGLVLLAVAVPFVLAAFGTGLPEMAGGAMWAFAVVWYLAGVITSPGIPYALPFLPTFLRRAASWLTDTTVLALIGRQE